MTDHRCPFSAGDLLWDGGRCAVLDADQRIVGYLPPGRQAAGAAASALREAADGWSDWDALAAPEDWLRERADRIESGDLFGGAA